MRVKGGSSMDKISASNFEQYFLEMLQESDGTDNRDLYDGVPVIEGNRTHVVATLKQAPDSERNIDKPRLYIKTFNRSKTENKASFSDDFLEAIKEKKSKAQATYAKGWEAKHLYASKDLASMPPIIQTHDIQVIFGKVNEPSLLRVKKLSEFTDENFAKLLDTTFFDYVELFCGNNQFDDFDLYFIPNKNAVEFAQKYTLYELICNHVGYRDNALNFKQQLSTVKISTPPESWKNSLSKFQLTYWHSYAKELIKLNKDDECNNILQKINLNELQQVWIGEASHNKTMAIFKAYTDLLDGMSYLVELCLEFRVLHKDKPAVGGIYSGMQLIKRIELVRNSVKNALAINMIVKDFNYAVKNGIAIYIELLPILNTEKGGYILERINELLKHVSHALAQHSKIPAHLAYFADFLKNFVATELSDDQAGSKLPKLPLDVRRFLLQPQVIKAGEISFTERPLSVNIAYYFNQDRAIESLEQINCIACHLFNFDPFNNGQGGNQGSGTIGPYLKNAVTTTLSEWKQKSNGKVSMLFHETIPLQLDSAEKLLTVIRQHFERVITPILNYTDGVVLQQIGELHKASTSLDYKKYQKFNDKQKQLVIYQETHRDMTAQTFDFLFNLLEEEIALHAIRIIPKATDTTAIQNNLAVPLLNTVYGLNISTPHQYFGKQGELLIDLGYDKDNKHYAIYLGSEQVIELPSKFSNGLWSFKPLELPSTHFIEPMAVIIGSQGKAWGDYSQFYINRWFKQMPEHDELYADAVIFDDAPTPSMVNDVTVGHIEGIERKGRFI